jgi:uncharacterized protein
MTTILSIKNGSFLYGLNVSESDKDFVSIFVEDPQIVFSERKQKTSNFRMQPEAVKSSPGDIEITGFSVRHFFALTLAGNPSLLPLLFASENDIVSSTEAGQRILSHSHCFSSMLAAPRYRGYIKSQLDCMVESKKSHSKARRETLYRYDTKSATQIARLVFQGIEYFNTGSILSPLPTEHRRMCLSIRNGELDYPECLKLLTDLEHALEVSIQKSNLPQQPDSDTIWELSRQIHMETWDI